MRTNIELDDKLLSQVKSLSKSKTKRETVERALKVYLRWLKRQEILALRGKVTWEGDLDNMRSD
jgi:Arc/MetJ family transcription regulator